MPKLVFHDSDGIDKTLQLGTEPVTIGRASDCEVQTHDAMVSRKHARITWDGGAYWVEDLGSSNGVFLGQEKVQRAAFRPGDVVTCGSLVLRMVPEARRTASPVAEPEPAAAPARKSTKPKAAPPPSVQEWEQQPPTTASPPLAAAPNHAELQQLRADLQREITRRENAEQALLTAEQRYSTAEDSAREVMVLRRKLDQRDEDLRRFQEQLEQQPAPQSPIDLTEFAESVAVFNDALAEVKASLRAGGDEAKLLTAPPESVKVVRESLHAALDELERARGRLREMIRKLDLPES